MSSTLASQPSDAVTRTRGFGKAGPSGIQTVIFSLFKRDESRAAIDRLFHRIALAARAPALYADYGVPDTPEGRFEALALHVILVLRRLRALPAPAADAAQDLVDATFRELDRALREMGVGDTGVPKRMKALAQAFYGRAAQYDEAIDAPDQCLEHDLIAKAVSAFPGHALGDEALAAALRRNIVAADVRADGLAAYVREAERGLVRRDLDGMLQAGTLFPDPSRFAGKAG